MNTPNQVIILGGGSTITEGISKGLWDKLQNHFVIGINYSYHHFNSTLHLYLDYKFYNENKKDMDKLPLIITRPGKNLPSNTIQIKTASTYHRDVRKGCYKGSLTGIYAVSLGIYLLDIGEIFLLGFDFGGIGVTKTGKANTHYYKNIKHRGVGKINYYSSKPRWNSDFAPFVKEKKVKIYNISLQSKIQNFPKISYGEFFKKLNKKTFNQTELRTYIRDKLKP